MKRIFLVHDQQESPHLRAQDLEAAGYQVHLMKSGVQCIERLASGLPNLLIMDILLEGKHGFDVCRQIRRQYTPQELPILLCSDVYRSRPFREEANNAGAQAFLLTPITARDLLDAVAALTGSGHNLSPGTARS
jgi:CheY-like chemotaxis protein